MRRRCALCLFAVFAAFVVSLPAQETKPPEMNAAEIKKLATLLEGWKKLDRYDKKFPAAKAAFMKALDQVGAAHKKPPGMEDDSKWKHLLAMVDSWSSVFEIALGNGKGKKPSGRGTLKRDPFRIERPYKGRPVGFEYVTIIPPKYDHKQAWPMIVSLPPIEVEAFKYAKQVWMDKSLKAFREKFVIIVPTLGKKTRPKRRRDAISITAFNKFRMWNIYWPMYEMRKNLNIDSDRIYLDGLGKGGEIALQLAALRGKDFAAVSVRDAKPIALDVLPNLGEIPVRFHLRKTSVLTTEKDAALRKAIMDLAQKHGLDLEMKEYEPLDKKAKAKAKQYGDPIPEATVSILEAFAGMARNPYPSKVHFATPHLMFNRSYWFKLSPTEVGKESAISSVVEAEIDRKNNVINITQSNVNSLSLYLNDRLVDMDKVVKVVVNGKTIIEEKSDRSLDVMLKYRKGNLLDPGVVVTRQINVRIPDEEEEEKEETEDGDKK